MWAAKFQPQSFDDMMHAPQATSLLRGLSHAKNLPHILLSGPEGSGRHTRALCLVRAIFGQSRLATAPSACSFTTASGVEDQITVLASPYHLELNPSEAGARDVFVVQTVIREAASTRGVNSPFKILILQDADCLSFLAQQALRRLMEEYARTCKLILLCTRPSGLIPPVRSRCFCIRVPGFSDAEVQDILREHATRLSLGPKGEALEKASREAAVQSQGNMRRAWLVFQAWWALSSAKQSVSASEVLPEWELGCMQLCSQVILGPGKPGDVRARLIEMLKKGVPGTFILRCIYEIIEKALRKELGEDLTQSTIVQKSATASSSGLEVKSQFGSARTLDMLLSATTSNFLMYDERMKAGTSPLYHLEAFCIAVKTDAQRARDKR